MVDAVSYNTPTGNQNVDALLYGGRFASLGLTFQFPVPDFYFFGSNYFPSMSIQPSFASQVTANLASAIRYVLPNMFGAVTNLTFTEIGIPTFQNPSFPIADMAIFMGTPIGPGTAVGGIPVFSGQQGSGDAWFDSTNPGDYGNPQVGNFNWATVIHELGHALGLKHGHANDYGFTLQAMTPDRNSMEFSIMTYRGYIGADPTKGYANETGGYATTLMMYDIYALQTLYGANYNWNSGNTVYTFNPTTGAASINGNLWLQGTANRIFLTVWDGGGNDTYDLSNYTTDLQIDLQPGNWSTLSQAQLANLGNGNFARANVFNSLLFNGDQRSLIENAKGGSGNDSLTGNIVANTLEGNNGNDNLRGLAGNDTLNGGAGNDTLYGGAGIDSMVGGAGNDWFFVDDAADLIVETAGGGTDRAFVGVSWTLTAGAEIERTSTDNNAGTAAININGNELKNIIYGNAGNNIIDGKGGADILVGLGGNDWFFVDNAGDFISEAIGGGTDRVLVDVSYILAGSAEVELITTINNAGTSPINITGNNYANTIYGNAGNNILDGQGGVDTLIGLGGNDWFFVDNAGDRVLEDAGGGTDRVFAGVSWSLTAGSEVEALSTSNNPGVTPINLTGNELRNLIYGNNGSNTLDGKAGADTLAGLGGNDTYFVDNSADVISEAIGGGNDRVFTSVSYTLSAASEVENLSTTSDVAATAINLTGNQFNNVITGNAGSNTLDGKGGVDTLIGLGGNDFYYVDAAGDIVVETAGGGNDRVFASVSYALGGAAAVEILTTSSNTGTGAINLTGNALPNVIYGNEGANRLNGKGGADVLVGLGGPDVFVFDTALGGGNIDTVSGYIVGLDSFELSRSIFNTLPTGTLSASGFVRGAAAVDEFHRIIYNQNAGDLLYDADGTGAAQAVMFAHLAAGLALSNLDFHIV